MKNSFVLLAALLMAACAQVSAPPTPHSGALVDCTVATVSATGGCRTVYTKRRQLQPLSTGPVPWGKD